VDDGCTDRTRTLAEAWGARHPCLRVQAHPTRKGPGAALRTGLRAARFPLLVCTACDPGYRASDLAHLLKWIDQVDLVAGYRVRAKGSRGRSSNERVYRWVARLFFGVRFRDPGCRFVLARRSLFDRFPIQSDGDFAHVEVLAKANFLECLMTEVPVAYQPRGRRSAARREGLRQRLAGARRIFSHPDFGPPFPPGAEQK
jgi:glycosyltransferase involved in cell wall biosynthesis